MACYCDCAFPDSHWPPPVRRYSSPASRPKDIDTPAFHRILSSTTPLSPTSGPPFAPAPAPNRVPNSNGKRKSIDASAKDEDLATLLCSSLSDYVLRCSVGRSHLRTKDVRALLHTDSESSISSTVPSQLCTTTINLISALDFQTASRCPRQHCHTEDTFESCTLVAAPYKDAEYSMGVSTEEQGGYKICKD